MKLITTISLFLLVLLCSCHLDVNTTNPQYCRSVEASREAGVFVREYKLLSTTDTNIKVEEAWIEKVWFNNINGLTVDKKIKEWNTFVFKLEDTPGLIYDDDNRDNWSIEGENSYYVGTVSSRGKVISYTHSLQENIAPDTLRYKLIKRTHVPNECDKTVGSIIFVAVQ